MELGERPPHRAEKTRLSRRKHGCFGCGGTIEAGYKYTEVMVYPRGRAPQRETWHPYCLHPELLEDYP